MLPTPNEGPIPPDAGEQQILQFLTSLAELCTLTAPIYPDIDDVLNCSTAALLTTAPADYTEAWANACRQFVDKLLAGEYSNRKLAGLVAALALAFDELYQERRCDN